MKRLINIDDVMPLYLSGYSQIAIADTLGFSQGSISVFVRKHGLHGPWKFAKAKSHPMWKGDAASYSAFHKRMTAVYGCPSRCEHCGRDDESVKYDWANMTGDYGNDKDYKRLCRPCHRKMDSRKSSSSGWKHGPTFVTIGSVAKTLGEWAEDSGIPRNTLRWRMKIGISPEHLLDAGKRRT